ncbi:hypothetical protein GCM10029992_45770 [Glycomyces albus]
MLRRQRQPPADRGGLDGALALSDADVPLVVRVGRAREGLGQGLPDLPGYGLLRGGQAPQGRVSSSNQFSCSEWFDMVTVMASGPRAANSAAGLPTAIAAASQPL